MGYFPKCKGRLRDENERIKLILTSSQWKEKNRSSTVLINVKCRSDSPLNVSGSITCHSGTWDNCLDDDVVFVGETPVRDWFEMSVDGCFEEMLV
jgi:hypothetical protein